MIAFFAFAAIGVTLWLVGNLQFFKTRQDPHTGHSLRNTMRRLAGAMLWASLWPLGNHAGIDKWLGASLAVLAFAVGVGVFYGVRARQDLQASREYTDPTLRHGAVIGFRLSIFWGIFIPAVLVAAAFQTA